MPNRILREGINSSARVNRLSLGAEVLYRRLISVADDYGRYYANLTTVRGGCWPTHSTPPCEQDVSRWIAECRQGDRPLLTIYIVDGCNYLQINDFNQKVRSKSKFPDPAIGLLASCEQVVDKMPALDVVEDGVVLRNAESYPQSERAAANGTPKPIPLPSQTEWPLTIAEIRKHDPAVDDIFVLRLAQACIQGCLSSKTFPQEKIDLVTDKVIAKACAESFATGPPNHRAGLLLNRVPPILISWSVTE